MNNAATADVVGRRGRARAAARVAWLLLILSGLMPGCAHAAPEEIVIFADEGEKPGETGYELHINKAVHARRTPAYPGEQPPHGVLRFMPEVEYGLAENWNVGLHLPMSNWNGSTTVDGFKTRFTNVIRRDTGWGSWFYGANYELSYFKTRLSDSRVVAELLGILGMRYGDWLFVVNPEIERVVKGNIPDLDRAFGIGMNLKVARKMSESVTIGVEHYGMFGTFDGHGYYNRVEHITYAILEFLTRSHFDIHVGVGHGWTNGSDQTVFKAIIGLPF